LGGTHGKGKGRSASIGKPEYHPKRRDSYGMKGRGKLGKRRAIFSKIPKDAEERSAIYFSEFTGGT